MPGITIRKADSADARRLADIAFQAWEHGIYPLLAAQPGLRESEKYRLTQVVAETISRIIVAEVDGIVVGWCSMLLRRMESMLELAGAERVHLETPADNVPAVRFYEKQGYRILALRSDGRDAHEPFMSVHLEKRLLPFDGDLGHED